MSLVINADEFLEATGLNPDITSQYTLFVWSKVENTSAGWKPLVNFRLSGETTVTNGLLAINGGTYDHWNAPSSTIRLDNAGSASTSAWQAVALRYNQATPQTAAYLNGSSTQTNGSDAGAIAGGNDPNLIWVGKTDLSSLSAGTVYFRGKLAHLSLWNIALSDTNLADLAAGVNPQDIEPSSLKLYADFDTDATVTIGGVTFTATGSPTYDGADNPTVDAPGGGGFTLTANEGTFTHTGQSTNLLFGRKLTADYGSFALSGQDVTLTKTTAYSLTADYGSFSLSGQDVTFQKTDAGAYVLTAEVGLFSLVGQGALASYSMSADTGSFALSGQDVTFSVGVPAAYSLQVDAGIYSLTGYAARLDWSGAPVVPNRQAGIYMGMRIGL